MLPDETDFAPLEGTLLVEGPFLEDRTSQVPPVRSEYVDADTGDVLCTMGEEG